MSKLGQAITAVENFVAKEVKGADKLVQSVTAFIQKEEPEIKKILADAQAAYVAAKTAAPYIEETVNALAILCTEISLLL